MLNRRVLRGSRDFSAVYRKGRSAKGRYVIVLYRKNGLAYNRKAFLASKKVGNAVERNRARRLMKESFRLMNPLRKEGYDIIFIARNTINGKSCGEVKKSIESALKKTELK